MKSMTHAFTLCLTLASLSLAGCASTPDEERAQLSAAVSDASSLASEIGSWNVPGDVSSAVIETVEGFKTRADDVLDRLEGFDSTVTQGVDLSDLEHALTELSQFDTDRLEEASNDARRSMLQQLQRLAENVQNSAMRVTQSLV